MASFCGLHNDEKRPGVPRPSLVLVEEHELFEYDQSAWAWDKKQWQTDDIWLPVFWIPGTRPYHPSELTGVGWANRHPRKVTQFEQITPLS